MKTHQIPVVALSLALGGCSLFGGSKSPEPEKPLIEQGSKDTARAGDQQMLESLKGMDKQIDETEAKLKGALELALGKSSPYPGQQPPPPFSTSVTELRAAKIDLYIAPVLDAQGKQVGAGSLVELKDSYTDGVQKLSRKLAEGKATKKEMKFVQSGATSAMKLNDVKGQVRAAVMPAMDSGWMVTTGSTTSMQVVSGMIKTRRQMEMEWTDEDYEIVRVVLEQQSRREAIAAVSIGLLATYQAVAGGGADPTLIDDVANGTLEALPLEGAATIDQAKDYVIGFDDHVPAAHAQYEAQMRKTFGDAEYEASYKAQIDGMFARLGQATSAKSATEMQAETMAKYRVDLEKCARGEAPDPAGMVGPGKCKEAKANAGEGGALSEAVMTKLLGKTDTSPQGLAKEGARRVLALIPGGKQIQRALDGVKALRDGDVSVALRLAADLVPLPGPAKMALSSAASIAEALPKPDMKKLRKRRNG